mgnify:CR=1 FL=1
MRPISSSDWYSETLHGKGGFFPLRSEAVRAARSGGDGLRGEVSLRTRGIAPGGMGEARSDSGGIEKGGSPLRRGLV